MFWDFPTLDQLHNVRLYRAPSLEEDDQNCPGRLSTATRRTSPAPYYAIGDSNSGDPGVSGKGKSFSDYEVVDRTGNDLTAKVRIGLKWFWDAGIKFDLKAVVKRNGVEVSSGELLGSPGGGILFQNAKLRTIPLSFPTQTFVSGRQHQRQGPGAQLLPRQPAADRRREAVVRRQLHESVHRCRECRPSTWSEAMTTNAKSGTTTEIAAI